VKNPWLLLAASEFVLCGLCHAVQDKPAPQAPFVEGILDQASIEVMYELSHYSWLAIGRLRSGQVLVVPGGASVDLEHRLGSEERDLIGKSLSERVDTPFGFLHMKKDGVVTERLRGPCVFVTRRSRLPDDEKWECAVTSVSGDVITCDQIGESTAMPCRFERIGVGAIVESGAQKVDALARLRERWAGKSYFIPSWSADRSRNLTAPEMPLPNSKLGWLSFAKVQIIYPGKSKETGKFIMESLFLSAIELHQKAVGVEENTRTHNPLEKSPPKSHFPAQESPPPALPDP
jgi:hypothetical protein